MEAEMRHSIRDGVLITNNIVVEICSPGDLADYLAGRLKVLDRIETSNLVVDNGLNALRDLMMNPYVGGVGASPDYIALGTDGSEVVASQTALVAEAFRKQITRRSPLNKALIWQMFMAATEGNGGGTVIYKEIGLFEQAIVGAGRMWARGPLTSATKTSSVSITVNWQMNLAAT